MPVEKPGRSPPGARAPQVAAIAADQMILAIATAVSAMRLEKPHSLSYQDRMRTKRAVHHLGLVQVEGRRVGVVVEVDRDVRLVGVAEHALERAVGGGSA